MSQCGVRTLLAVAALIALAVPARRILPEKVSHADSLAKSQAYVAAYDRDLAALVADEHYLQREVRADGQIVERRLESEFAWVPLPSGADTIGVRDVRRVDGEPVARNGRLRSLLEKPSQAIEREVQAILDESARYNLAPAFQRNINFPTFALSYLRRTVADNSKWKARLLPTGKVELQFRENRRRTLVRSRDGMMMQAEGAFIVDASNGRVEGFEVVLQQPRQPVPRPRDGTAPIPTFYKASVTFAMDSRLHLWLPATMRDEVSAMLEDPLGHRPSVTGEAHYDGYRRFEASGRIVP
jgi:hypothetical protein